MQKKRRRWPAILGVVLVGLLGTLYLQAPSWLRHYLEHRYAGVTIDGLEIHWLQQQVTLHGVTVHRDNLTARLPLVEADRQKNVRILGGNVEVTLAGSEGPSETSRPEGVKFTAENLSVTVHYRDATAVLLGTKVDPAEVCFNQAKIDMSPRFPQVSVTEGCARRDKTFARASLVEAAFRIPELPGLSPLQTINIQGVEVEPLKKEVRFERILVDDWLALQGPASVKLADDKVFLKVPRVEVEHPWLGSFPVFFAEVEVTAPKGITKGEHGVVDVQLGQAKVKVDPFDRAISGEEPCRTWFDAMPKPLPEALEGMAEHFTGDLGFEVRVKPAPKVSVKSTCKFDCSASPIAEVKKPKFTYLVYDAKNNLVERETGPGTSGWMGVGGLPLNVPKAFVLMEDPDFPNHHGVLAGALENSLKVNLEKGGFMKGGSTISMQLAKNLWLRRHKTIGRKAEEALLTFALESCFSKEQILEMYLNVIEFGPNVYGIGAAAKHYFHKEADKLTVEEAFYLASILPAPRSALPPKQGGLARAKRIMKSFARSGSISEYLVDDGKALDTTGWEVAQ